MAGRAKPPRDPGGKHVRLYNTMLDSPAYRALGWSSRALLVDLRASLTANNNGNISATLTTLKHRGWKSPATLANALFELQALGFIAKTRGGGVEYGSKVCSLYRFTDRECFEFPKFGIPHHKETHDYARFSSLAEAERTLAAAQAQRKEDAKRKKATLQKMMGPATESVANDEIDATESVEVPA